MSEDESASQAETDSLAQAASQAEAATQDEVTSQVKVSSQDEAALQDDADSQDDAALVDEAASLDKAASEVEMCLPCNLQAYFSIPLTVPSVARIYRQGIIAVQVTFLTIYEPFNFSWKLIFWFTKIHI